MATQVDSYTQLTTMNCGECGVAFAIPETMRNEKQSSGGSWYCPNGHGRHYSETREDKLRKELTTEMRRRAEAEQKQRESEARLLKIEKRISKGICPCCKRTFANVQRHMHTKHPEMGTVVGK